VSLLQYGPEGGVNAEGRKRREIPWKECKEEKRNNKQLTDGIRKKGGDLC